MPVCRFYCDDETGEVVTYDVNDETGELYYAEPAFRPPSAPAYQKRRSNKARYPVNLPTGCGYDGKKFKILKENITAGSNLVSYRMFLIPSVIFFPALFSVLLTILEIYLHVWCHKQNKRLKDTDVYYRSPFHVVTSIFCGVCRDCDSCSKVGQLQDQRRNNRYGYLQGIVL